jgi:hypothetical protein
MRQMYFMLMHTKQRKREYRKHYRRTQTGFTYDLWHRLNKRTINGTKPDWGSEPCRRYLEKGIELRLTREELALFVEQNWLKIKAIFDSGGTPSIDRINSNEHYEQGNVQIITWRENTRKGCKPSIPTEEEIAQAVKNCDGNRTHAAVSLGLSVRTIQRALRRLGINPPRQTSATKAERAKRHAIEYRSLTDAEVSQLKAELAGRIWDLG